MRLSTYTLFFLMGEFHGIHKWSKMIFTFVFGISLWMSVSSKLTARASRSRREMPTGPQGPPQGSRRTSKAILLILPIFRVRMPPTLKANRTTDQDTKINYTLSNSLKVWEYFTILAVKASKKHTVIICRCLHRAVNLRLKFSRCLPVN